MKKSIPKIREREGNEKIRERESDAFIFGNGREREFLLTSDPKPNPEYIGGSWISQVGRGK